MSELAAQFTSEGGAVSEVVAITSTASVVLGPFDVQAYDRYAIYVDNVGGGGAHDILECTLQSGPTDEGPWAAVDSTFAENVASGDADIGQFSNKALKFVRVLAACDAAETTTGQFWFSAGGAE